MMIDGIVLACILIAAIFGWLRGIVSQMMALAGLLAAYFLAPPSGEILGGLIQKQMGWSRFMSDKLCVLLIGVLVYVGFRLLGLGIERLLVNRAKEFRRLNRWGGLFLGVVKSVVLFGIVFSFLTLAPRETVKAWAPKMLESHVYQYVAEHNPMGQQIVLERLRRFRGTMKNPEQADHLKDSLELKDLLSRYKLSDAFRNKNFVESLEKGDFKSLSHNEQVESLMRDDKLVGLLEELERTSP